MADAAYSELGTEAQAKADVARAAEQYSDRGPMSNTLQFDADAAKRIQAIYTTEDVIQQRSLTIDALHLQPGQRVLDLGSGPGYLAASTADEVGETGEVIGLDMQAPPRS